MISESREHDEALRNFYDAICQKTAAVTGTCIVYIPKRKKT